MTARALAELQPYQLQTAAHQLREGPLQYGEKPSHVVIVDGWALPAKELLERAVDDADGELELETILQTIKRLGYFATEVEAVDRERKRRVDCWRALTKNSKQSSDTIEQLGIRPKHTGQGIYRGAEAQKLAAQGVTMSLLDLGDKYADTFDDVGGVYFYPRTRRAGSRDANEIEATKNARALGLPLFLVTSDGKQSQARLAEVVDWDDEREIFYLSFLGVKPKIEMLMGKRGVANKIIKSRSHAIFSTIRTFGRCCAVCGVSRMEMLRIVPVQGASVRSGRTFVMCLNHARAYEERLFAIDPSDLRIHCRSDTSLTELGLTRSSLAHLHEVPERKVLNAAFERFKA